ncbi:3-methyl-2-oxobutanoate dehydrogenase subunit VorB [Huintestinicola sp.]|uniref:3-methyl-2-oxobutanoate dehydrogenase subunit VorB n=1 Tax=Huintestinicola sp. TaxID=2981661 RepID=UPI002A9023AB|nr:3-methyl-2-oxobutanoate dehydrogenase subunit VorB [Oscillospiraceae bacterium]
MANERMLMKGNEALAEAAVRAGCKCYFGYPITPQTEIAAYMSKRMPKCGGVFLQAESEIAAINMVYGAAATGVRAMTSSSSPGISLKSEGISYAAGCDLPCVVVNVQRGGPGLGGIQPAQSDYYLATKAGGHGDFYIPVYAPCSVQEMADYAVKAFDMADKFRTPVMILSDGLLGQMMEPVVFPEITDNEPEKEWACTGHGNKRRHNIINSLYLKPEELEESNRERFKKYEIEKAELPEVETYLTEDAEIIVTGYGASARIVRSAVNAARAEGIKAGMIRPITLWPFPEKAYADTVETAKAYLVVELSMGQMVDDVRLATSCKRPVRFFGRTGGVIHTPAEILDQIKLIAKEELK